MTRAPAGASARAVARPMPRDAPVTNAVLLMRSVMVVLLSGTRIVWMNLRSGLATIHIDDLTGDERRLAGGCEHDGVGDLFGSSRAFQRHAGNKARLPVGIAGDAIQHRGLNRAGRDRVDADAERGCLERRRLG